MKYKMLKGKWRITEELHIKVIKVIREVKRK